MPPAPSRSRMVKRPRQVDQPGAVLGAQLHRGFERTIAGRAVRLAFGSLLLLALVHRPRGDRSSQTIAPVPDGAGATATLSLIHISEPTRLLSISYAVFCLQK